MVKRGCAHKDKRYDRTGCEEQLTGGKGSFWLTLCLCSDSYCNSVNDTNVFSKWTTLLITFVAYHLNF